MVSLDYPLIAAQNAHLNDVQSRPRRDRRFAPGATANEAAAVKRERRG
jgi:hypothetical protein